jgi:hypothetical protein
MMLRFLDTNILLYSISRDPTETAKRDRAVALIDEGGNADPPWLEMVGPPFSRPCVVDPAFAVAAADGMAALRSGASMSSSPAIPTAPITVSAVSP